MSGIAVECVRPPVTGLSKIVVGRILRLAPHPDSDHLLVCRVETGSENLQIVSGAPNLYKGMLAPVALPGVTLPTGEEVLSREIRGVSSEGVLCSGAELGTDAWGYGDDKGVLALHADFLPGTPLDVALGLHDQILEFELTPNRGDCLAAINIAREVRALTGGELTLPGTSVRETDEKTAGLIQVEIAEPSLCRRYAARIIRNIRLADSPPWLQYRLRAAGVRPINNIVDVTNYVMLEMGQPLHAFDYEKLHDHRIIVRKPRPGEKMVFLDGVDRDLDVEMLVIADAREPVALGGVMGGLASEVTEATRTVLLESACFDPLNIRRTAKLLGMRTEASQRFEKGIDLAGVTRALDRAAHLIIELGAGVATEGIVDEYVSPAAPLAIRIRTARVNQVLGTHLTRSEVLELLGRLDFNCEICGRESLLVDIPSYRHDITQEIDLVEEVARLYGYEHIRATFPVGTLAPEKRAGDYNPVPGIVVEAMVNGGLDEVITYSFISEGSLQNLAMADLISERKVVPIQNPLREEQKILRPTLLPGLAATIAGNYKRKQEHLGIFELGTVFTSAGRGSLPVEVLHLGIAACGEVERGWQESVRERDYYYVKGIIENMFAMLGINGVVYRPWQDTATLHPGRAAQICVGSEIAGFLGDLHPDVLEKYELPVRVVVCELDLDLIRAQVNLTRVFQPLPRYPGIIRDLAVVVPESVPAGRVKEIILTTGGELLMGCRLFDLYKGPQVPAGRRSLAYSLHFQSQERTLTDEDVAEIYDRIQKNLAEQLDARLR